MSTKIRWLGHAAMALDTAGFHVLIDPFFTGNPKASITADQVKADFILISHGHGDHVGDSIAIAQRTGATVICNYEISLWMEQKGVKTFRSVLTNVSNRRQSLGINFLVRVKGLHDLQYFFVDGEPIAPNASIAVKDLNPTAAKDKDKEQPKDWVLQTQSGNLQGEVLEGVMQVYDWRTAPIKRIDKMLTGVQSSRTVSSLEPPLFEKTEASTNAPGGMQTGGDTSSGANPATSGGGDMQEMLGKMRSMMGGRFGGAGGGSSDKTKNGLEKNRCMSVSKQVRRMPVALAIVIEQNHIQEFLTVVANSKLRIQTTQVYWQRFHGDIKPNFPKEEKPGEATTPGGKVPPPPGGRTGLPMFGGKLGGKFGGMGGMAEGGAPGMANMAAMMNQMKSRMTMRGGMNMGGMGPMGPPSAPGASPAASYDSIEPEEETNLVELAFYGIASLYERYPPKKEGTEQPGQVVTPNPEPAK